MLGQIVIGIILMGIGVITIYYSGPISQAIGRSSWADQYLGGTKNAVVLFGFIVIILGVLFAFGVFKGMSLMGETQTNF